MAKRVKNKTRKRRTYRKKTNRVSNRKRINKKKTVKRKNINPMIKIGGSDKTEGSGKLQIDSENFFKLLKMLGIDPNLADRILNSANRAETDSVEELTYNYGTDIGVSLAKGLAAGAIAASIAGTGGAIVAGLAMVAKKMGFGAGTQIVGDKLLGLTLKILDKKFFDDLTNLISSLFVFSFDSKNNILEINLIESGTVISLRMIKDGGVNRLPIFFINIKDILITILPEILKVLKQNKNINDLIVKTYGSFDNFQKEVYKRIDESQTGGGFFRDKFDRFKEKLLKSKPVRAIKESKEKATNKLKDKGSIKFTLLGLDLFIFVQNKLDNKYKYLTLMLDERGNLVFCASEHKDKLYDSKNRLTLSSLISSKQLAINQASENAAKIMDRLFEEEQELITQGESSSQPASPPTEPVALPESLPNSPEQAPLETGSDELQTANSIAQKMSEARMNEGKCNKNCEIKHEGTRIRKDTKIKKCKEKCTQLGRVY